MNNTRRFSLMKKKRRRRQKTLFSEEIRRQYLSLISSSIGTNYIPKNSTRGISDISQWDKCRCIKKEGEEAEDWQRVEPAVLTDDWLSLISRPVNWFYSLIIIIIIIKISDTYAQLQQTDTLELESHDIRY